MGKTDSSIGSLKYLYLVTSAMNFFKGGSLERHDKAWEKIMIYVFMFFKKCHRKPKIFTQNADNIIYRNILSVSEDYR